jgi:hypothetical protein
MNITNILVSLLILLSFCILMVIKYGFSRIRELEKHYEYLRCDSQRMKRTVDSDLAHKRNRKIING